MKKVIIASKNPVKVAVAEDAFTAVFPGEQFHFVPADAPSGVPDQPFDEETRQGALNRLAYIRKEHPDADYWISQEGGLHHDGDVLFNRAWIVIMDKEGNQGVSSTPSFEIPPGIALLVRSGLELSAASDRYFGATNLGCGVGGISFLTDGLIDRKHFYLPAAIIALAQVKKYDLYK